MRRDQAHITWRHRVDGCFDVSWRGKFEDFLRNNTCIFSYFVWNNGLSL